MEVFGMLGTLSSFCIFKTIDEFYGFLVHFVVSLVYFSILVCCSKKNLAAVQEMNIKIREKIHSLMTEILIQIRIT
jgi:hypothetical protein